MGDDLVVGGENATNKELAPGFYDDADKQRFVSYFSKPKKRGRPPKKKRKRGRPKKEPNKKVQSQKQCMIDMTTKESADQLDARLEATVKASRDARKRQNSSRINWDVEPHCTLRNRIADSWIKKEDLYAKNDTLNSFCTRCNFSRAVLTRYLPRRRKELAGDVVEARRKRGRPTHLSESVMRHICEGNLLFIFLFFFIVLLTILLLFSLQSLKGMTTRVKDSLAAK